MVVEIERKYKKQDLVFSVKLHLGLVPWPLTHIPDLEKLQAVQAALADI